MCAGCKSAYYRYNHKLLLYLISSWGTKKKVEGVQQQVRSVQSWHEVSEKIFGFLRDNYLCNQFKNFSYVQNCTTLGNIKCKGCKLVKIVLKLKKFPSNLENIGWVIKELINDNKDKIFDDLVQRFGGKVYVKTPALERIKPKIEVQSVCEEIVVNPKKEFQFTVLPCQPKTEVQTVDKGINVTSINEFSLMKPNNTLPHPNIQIQVIDYICQCLNNNSDKHFTFQNSKIGDPMICLDDSYPYGSPLNQIFQLPSVEISEWIFDL